MRRILFIALLALVGCDSLPTAETAMPATQHRQAAEAAGSPSNVTGTLRASMAIYDGLGRRAAARGYRVEDLRYQSAEDVFGLPARELNRRLELAASLALNCAKESGHGFMPTGFDMSLSAEADEGLTCGASLVLLSGATAVFASRVLSALEEPSDKNLLALYGSVVALWWALDMVSNLCIEEVDYPSDWWRGACGYPCDEPL
jgi:hypothetical protein